MKDHKKGNFWIWGLHAVLAALEHSPEILSEVLFVESELSDATLRRLSLLKDKKALQLRSVPSLPKNLEEHRHQGIAASLKYFPYLSAGDLKNALEAESGTGTWLLLDGIEDPRNFGAILRSCAAFAVNGVIVGEKFQAPISGVVAQASAGTCFQVPIYEIPSTLGIFDQISAKSKAIVVGLDSHGMSLGEVFQDPDLKGRDLIWVLGAEGKGIHARLRQKIEKIVSIPMCQGVESLNASVAAGIVLYSAYQKRL